MRTFLFWCHLVAGVVAGVVILTMSATGVLLTYEKQMLVWADTRGLNITAPEGAAPLPVQELVERVRQAHPDSTPASVTLRNYPDAPVALGVGPRSLQVNPYSGEVVGEGAVGLRAFFRSVTEWHRYLAMSGESRPTGRAITGAANLAFLFIVGSGVVLWWPKSLRWRQVRQVMLFRGGLRGKARDFNWHNVIGFWSAVPLFVIVLGSAVISYPWASDLVYAAFGDAPPPRQRPAGAPGPAAQRPAGDPRPVLEGLDRALQVAKAHDPAWRTLTARLATSDRQPLSIVIDRGTGGQPQLRTTIEVDRLTGAVVREEGFAGQSAGRRARSWLRFAHTGEVYGLFGQSIAGLVSLGGCVLMVTGLMLAIRRFAAWRSRMKNGRALKAA